VTHALDVLVRRAQRRDEQALELLVGALRGPLLRHVRRLGCAPADCEDVVQETLIDVVRGIAGYRWQASFLSWAYAIASRRAARHARRSAAAALSLLQAFEQSIRLPEDPLAPAEAILVEQDAHLACAFVVAEQLSDGLRRAYLLGEALGVTDAVGAEVCGISRVAFRQRVSRARREVEGAIRQALDAAGSAPAAGAVNATVPVELDRLLRLGELHRTSARSADARAVLRAARLAAPSLLAGEP
jgi:RNA polymerase sigma factor (sigma-70 family)